MRPDTRRLRPRLIANDAVSGPESMWNLRETSPEMAKNKTLCLNMIVKNEMANLDRCLRAVADHIACWVIGDTGSTDGTQDFVKSFFAERGIPGELHSFPFLNFEQARNAALEHAAASNLSYDYLLFDDADMELVVEDLDFRAKLEEPGYLLIQRTDSGLVYWNTRLVRRDAGARYHGLTHEYIDVPGGVKELRGVWYKDYASGSNRTDKFQRDIDLLLKALEQEPNNHRYWFYLAQSHRDAGQKAKAAEIYAKRAAMGGWDEEAWYARLEQARCLRDVHDDAGFIREALAAFNQRPQRAEPLYDLARYYRERGMTAASVVFSEFALTLPQPNDMLFLEDFVYTAGLCEEYSIAANYARDPARKDRGHDACNWLALSRKVPEGTRNLARRNLLYYIQPASVMMPSFAAREVSFTPPEGYHPLNPSVARWGEQIMLVQRTANFILNGDNQYETPNGAPVHTRNFLLRLDPMLKIESSTEILPPRDMPEPLYPRVIGFEDMRLFSWQSELWCTSTVRELTEEGWCDQVLARIDQRPNQDSRLTDWRVLRPEGQRRHEKNWMPLVDHDRLQFIYLCDPTRILDEQARNVAETLPQITAADFRGSSQVIPFDGGWLALIHEVLSGHDSQRRTYQHRFVWLDEARVLRRVSRAFYFHKSAVEFAAGLAWHPDGKRLMVSFSVQDRESWIATVDAEDVRNVLQDAERGAWTIIPTAKDALLPAPASPGIISSEKEEGANRASEAAVVEMERDRKAEEFEAARCRRIFVMISTERSLLYTRHAVASFFQCTDFTPLDRFLLIANDHAADEFRTDSRLEVIENDVPKSFAANVNRALRAARAHGADLVLLNNDMIFVHGWLPPLLQFPDAITLPMCNYTHEYQRDDLNLRRFMDWEQFGGKFDALEEIARSHRERFAEGATQTDLLMPFYCFHLPNKILAEVGEFDESLGHAGGEDVDYRLRTLLSGYDVVYAGKSYVLHFNGKSTWRSGESARETAERDKAYFARFTQKWGDDAAAIFLASRKSLQRINELGLEPLVATRQFRRLVEHCLNRSPLTTTKADAQSLTTALQTEKDPFLRSRYIFYLARSFRDAGEKEKALAYFLKRAGLGNWSEEVFMSLYSAGQLQQEIGRPIEEVVATYLRASEAAPTRAEALHAASRLCREKNKFAEGYEYARRGLAIPLPASGLFVETWQYDYGLLDEFAVNAYWIGRYQECLDACQRLLREGKLPREMHDRVRKNAEFAADKLGLQRTPTPPSPGTPARSRSTWAPKTPLGGTELMVTDLRKRMGAELDRINLQVNHPGHDKNDARPRVVWMHHDANQSWVQWCKDKELVDSVDCFVFVSNWQRDRYLNAFQLPAGKCFVLRHALEPGAGLRHWEAKPIWRCAYTSTPFRGLSVLLDAWQRLSPGNAELHIWSSMKIYLLDDSPYEHLYQSAESTPGVFYHGIAPNPEVRAALRDMDFLVYPCTFEETSCLAAIEAMAAGCRVIAPAFGALPETTHGFARLYPWVPDKQAHAAAFAATLAEELQNPWNGQPELAIAQQRHCASHYDWDVRIEEWRRLIDTACSHATDANMEGSAHVPASNVDGLPGDEAMRDPGPSSKQKLLPVGFEKLESAFPSPKSKPATSRLLNESRTHSNLQMSNTQSEVPFPGVFVINLDERVDRWISIQETCRNCGLEPTRVSAERASPGWVGCGRSHLKIIKNAKEKCLPWVLILEDDASFDIEGITRFRALLPYLWNNRDKWERFSGGPCFAWNPELRVLDIHRQLIYIRGWSCHFDLIHGAAYDSILTWDSAKGRPIDVFYCDLAEKGFRNICTYPHIATQINSVSDNWHDDKVKDVSRYFGYSSFKLRECLNSAAPHAKGMLEINAAHPNWRGILCVSEEGNFLWHKGTERLGTYEWCDGRFIARWYDSPQETFVEVSGNLIHADLVDLPEQQAEHV